MNNIQVYGDGNGNIIIEEWSSDSFDDEDDLMGRVKISVDRFELIASNCQELVRESWGANKK